ncbi:MAG TPA: hypothetical protein VIT91_00470 [Chthoniobacterales bacterium]
MAGVDLAHIDAQQGEEAEILLTHRQWGKIRQLEWRKLRNYWAYHSPRYPGHSAMILELARKRAGECGKRRKVTDTAPTPS